MSDQTERDGGDGGPENGAGSNVHELCCGDGREHWSQRDQERADADADNGERSHTQLRAHLVDQPAAGHLPQQAREATNGEHQADVDLRPFLGRQIDR